MQCTFADLSAFSNFPEGFNDQRDLMTKAIQLEKDKEDLFPMISPVFHI